MTIPAPFADLPAPIASALVARGFTELSSVQRAVVEAESAGRDLRISSQTGSGKTVAIGLALAPRFLGMSEPTRPKRPKNGKAEPVALVIVPTRELAAQVREELRWLYANLRGATVEVVTGGTSIGRERMALGRGPSLVVGTPGRLLDHLRAGALDCGAVEHVVLDEADQMLDMGFRDELEGILQQLPAERSSHLVSATFPRAVQTLADGFQRDALVLEGTKLGVANADIQHVAYAVRRPDTYAALVNVLLLAGDARCLLFVNRRIDATQLAEKLAADGFGAAPLSGELPQAQRTRTLASFRTGTFNILVSTDVAARGIDVPEISAVIHVDAPRTADAYVHRSGRTGRAGRTGRSVLFVPGGDTRRMNRLLQAAGVPVSWESVPRATDVEKILSDAARSKLHENLAAAQPTVTEKQHAQELLEGRDPVEVVASLLKLAEPKAARSPMDVRGLEPVGTGRPGRRAGAPNLSSTASGPNGAFTRFCVSWGESTGATTARLLSHVCRRGELQSHHIGSIEIHAKSAVIDIASNVADLFELRARRPDRRDPGVTIWRLGAAPGRSVRGTERPPHRPSATAKTPRAPSSPKTSSGPAEEAGRRKRPGRPAMSPARQAASRVAR